MEITCGDGNCVVAEVSPTATQVERDLDEASKRNSGVASDNWISERDLWWQVLKDLCLL